MYTCVLELLGSRAAPPDTPWPELLMLVSCILRALTSPPLLERAALLLQQPLRPATMR